MEDFKPATRRVIAAAAEHGLTPDVQRFPAGTATAQDAADAIGCPVGAIAKSIVVTSDDGPVLVLTSGVNRVDFAKVAQAAGVTGVRRASADEAKQATGYAIGGTAPFGHPQSLPILADVDLMGYATVWVAAGTPDTVFSITPDQLVATTGAPVVEVADR